MPAKSGLQITSLVLLILTLQNPVLADDSPGAPAAVPNTSQSPQPTKEDWESLETRAEQAFISGDLESARKFWKQALTVAESDHKQELNVATTLNQMNYLYMRTGEYEKAHQDLHKALAIREKLLGKDDLQIAETMGNLGLICEKLDRNQESEEWYQKALALKKRILPEDAPQLAVTMHNLARLYAEEKRYQEAIDLINKVIVIDEKAYGKNNVEVVRDVTTLGIVCFQCREFDEAVKYLEQALSMAKEGEIQAREDLQPIHHYLGIAYAQTKHPEKAKEHYEIAHQLGEELQSKGYTTNTTCILNLARNADDLGDTTCAEKLYKEAISKEDHRKPQNKLFLTQCLIEFGHYYRRHNQNEKAMSLYEHALIHYDTLPPHYKRQLYELPIALSEVLKELGRTTASEEIAQRYLHIHTPHGDKNFRL